MKTTTTGSHIKAKDLGFWGEIKWKFFMVKIRYLNWSFDKKNKIIRALFCKRGYHKIIQNGVVVSKNSRKSREMRVVLKVDWYECLNCKTLFFVNEGDKKKYLNYKNREDKNWGKLFESMRKERKCKKN